MAAKNNVHKFMQWKPSCRQSQFDLWIFKAGFKHAYAWARMLKLADF